MMRRELLHGMTMIEIMMVVAISASLALVGVPAYKRYVVKGKVAVMLDVATSIKLIIENDYQENGVKKTDLSSAADKRYENADFLDVSGYTQITSVAINDAVITITGNADELDTYAIILTFTPTPTGEKPIDSWECKVNSADYYDLVPEQCRSV